MPGPFPLCPSVSSHQGLRADLRVQLGLIEKFKSYRKKCAKFVSDTFSEDPPKYSVENCAGAPSHKFAESLHIF